MNSITQPDLKNIFSTQSEQNNFLLNLLDASGEMVMVFDTSLNISLFNKSCEKNFNVKSEEVKGRNVLEVFPSLINTQSHKDLLKALLGETIKNPVRLFTDNEFFILNQVIPLKTADGKVYAVMAIATDHTRQENSTESKNNADTRMAEQSSELLNHNMLAENILNSSVDVIMLLNKERELVALNKCATEILEPFSPVLIGKKIEEILPHITNSEAWDKFYECLEGKHVVVKEYKSRVNEKYWEINFSPLIKHNAVDAVMITCHNITGLMATRNELENLNNSLKEAMEDLRLSEERYHRMVEEVQDYAIILLDPSGYIQNWNKGAERIKGYSSAEIVGKNFIVFYTEEDRKSNLPNKLLKEAVENGKADYEGWRVRKGGDLFWGSILLTALKDKNGELVGFSKVTRDLTIKKLADDNLKNQAELLLQKNTALQKLNKELQAFAYVASHDLQEPLRKIQFFGNLIVQKEASNLSNVGKDHFRRMQEASKRMQTLIEDLLSFSRTNDGEKVYEKVDIKTVIKEVVYEMREAINEKVAIVTVGDMPVAEVIPFQFRQLMQNLISNALKFSDKTATPHIEIFSSAVNKSDLIDLPLKNQEYFKLSVKDDGIGFEPEFKERIFEIFQRLHGKHEYKGTGIGLAICKKIAEIHHGLIMAEGELGKGASFILYFPLTQTNH